MGDSGGGFEPAGGLVGTRITAGEAIPADALNCGVLHLASGVDSEGGDELAVQLIARQQFGVRATGANVPVV